MLLRDYHGPADPLRRLKDELTHVGLVGRPSVWDDVPEALRPPPALFVLYLGFLG